MSIPSAQVQEIIDAAENVVSIGWDLIAAREDGDREQREQASDEFDDALSDLIAALPKKAVK